MNNIPCLGVNFLANCSSSHYVDHFLFNLETAISGLAIIIAIYALFLERRFRIRIKLKNSQLHNTLFLVFIIIELTFISATLPYTTSNPRPIIGYPIFWEIIAFLILIFVIFQAYSLLKPITKLSKNQINNLIKLAPYDTLNYHGSVDLMVKEADYFWTDFLKKSLFSNSLKKILTEDFTNEDFLKVAVESQYILLQTVEVIASSSENTNHIKDYLRTLFLFSMTTKNSVISKDLESTYKPIMQHIMRERKLANVLLGDSTDLFFLNQNSKEKRLDVLKRFIKIFELHLGRQYHHTENKSGYVDLIQSDVLKNILEFFKDNLHHLNYNEGKEFMQKFSSLFIDLKNLPQDKSELLANQVYEILETYAIGNNWFKKSENERFLCLQLRHHFIEQNKYIEKTFKKRLLEKITGTNDKEVCNLDGYYPMMIPFYFFTFGHDLFCGEVPPGDFEFHMSILKKMQENLPKISSGKTQRFMNENIPNNTRSKKSIERKAEICLGSMFPDYIVYNRKENSITYYLAGDESSITLLLNETTEKNKFTYK